jgi:glycosyltransferase involved in cell wall biosynthesis
VVGVGFPGTEESAVVHRTVDELGLGRAVRVYDAYLPQDELARHYDLADVCVFPSTFEPFGLVSVEAMAHGRPTVLGPAFSRVITHDDRGPVVLQSRRDDSGELAGLLLRVLGDPAAAAELAERGRRHVEQRFIWDDFIDNVVGLLVGAERPVPREVSAC